MFKKPILKWVGGKTQILDTVLSKIPNEMNNYHELFLGGGSVLLGVLRKQMEGDIKINNDIYAYDINKYLIDMYKHIQNDKDKLYLYIDKYIKEYDDIVGEIINRKPKNEEDSKTSKESFYYWLRYKFNINDVENDVELSAIFIILNKTCFRGLYREGPNGFNVPFGHYKTTPNIDKKHIDYISSLIKNVKFIHCDFQISMKNIQNGDFVYLDPPYVPINETSFVNYVKNGFMNHEKLFQEIIKLNNNNIKFLLSNSNSKIVLDYFNQFNCELITARRAINSKNPESKVKEVLIQN